MAVVREDAEADMAATTACEQVSLPHTYTHTQIPVHKHTHTRGLKKKFKPPAHTHTQKARTQKAVPVLVTTRILF